MIRFAVVKSTDGVTVAEVCERCDDAAVYRFADIAEFKDFLLELDEPFSVEGISLSFDDGDDYYEDDYDEINYDPYTGCEVFETYEFDGGW